MANARTKTIPAIKAKRELLKEWSKYGSVHGDPREYIERVWARRLPKVYEALLGQVGRNEPIHPIAFDLLRSMTLMCKAISPQQTSRPTQTAIAESLLPAVLPSSVDLSHMTTEELARMTGREAPGRSPETEAMLKRRAQHMNKVRAEKKAKTLTPEVVDDAE